MGTPAAVQKQIDEANSIQKSIEDGKSEASKNDSSNLSVVDDKSKPEPTDQTTSNDMPDKDKGHGKSKEQLLADIEQFKSRYQAYKKMYDKEVHSFRTQLKKLTDEIAVKDASIVKLNSDLDEVKAQANKKGTVEDDDEAQAAMSAISEKFGSEFVDAVSDLTRAQLMEKYAGIASRLDAMESKLNSGSTKSNAQSDGLDESSDEPDDDDDNDDQRMFFTRLGESVPTWQHINNSMQWKEWLNGLDIDGRKRQSVLEESQRTGNAFVAAQLFQSFLQEFPRQSPEGDYLPKTSRGSADVDDDDVITGKELDEFYRLKALGKFSPKESEELEAKINRAMRNGNIRK